MNEIICPACGTSNPPDTQFCRACFRSLPTSAANEDSDAAWLSSFRNAQPPEEPNSEDNPSDAGIEPNENEPDWLKHIRQRAKNEGLVEDEQPFADRPFPGDDQEVPDWLKEIQQTAGQENGSNEEDLPDWLGSLDNSADTPPAENDAGTGTNDDRDWLSALQDESTAPVETPADNDSDWLQSLQNQPEPEPGSTENSEQDWLSQFKDFTSSVEAEQEQPDSSATNTGDSDADWLNLLPNETPDAAQEAGSSENAELSSLPFLQDNPNEPLNLGWLELAQEAETGQTAPAEEELSDDEELPLPDWLTSFDEAGAASGESLAGEDQPAIEQESFMDQAAAAPFSAAESTSSTGADGAQESDWLTNLQNEIPASQDSAAAEPNSQDWLSAGITDAAQEQANENPQELPAAPDDSQIPDWLTNLQSDIPASQEEAAVEKDDLPDWFNTAETDGAAASETASESADDLPAPPDDSEVPDWLTNLQSDIPADQEKEPAAEEDKGLPDWVDNASDAGSDHGLAPAEEELPQSPDESTIPSWLTSFENTEKPGRSEPAEEMPASMDWMAAGSEEPEAESPEPVEQPFEINQNLPSWMDDLNPEDYKESADNAAAPFSTADQPKQQASAPFGSDEAMPEISPEDLEIPPLSGQPLPAWLRDAAPEGVHTPVEAAEPAEDKSANLAPGEVPGWLQAMQPVESVAPQDQHKVQPDQVEAHGPLAGYQGVLPGQNLVTQYSKPPVYSARLQVDEKQRSYADMLESLLKEESSAAEVTAENRASSGIWLRMLLSLVLIAFIGYFLFSGSAIGAYPSLYAPETISFLSEMQTLSAPAGSAARVLVITDYEAGLSAEIGLAAVHPLHDLLASGARLTFLSDNPAGAVLAETLVANASADVGAYQPVDQFLNLGYLPGGVAAFASFAENPQKAAPVDFHSETAWSKAPLQGISALSDFNAVLILTDNGENVRAWIEQTSGSLGDTSLLVISSAQSAPIVQPYVQSGQVSGLVAGISGAAAYDGLTQRTDGTVRTYWDAYQATTLLIIAIILLGMVVQSIRKLSAPKKA
jgi:hypothetical protein